MLMVPQKNNSIKSLAHVAIWQHCIPSLQRELLPLCPSSRNAHEGCDDRREAKREIENAIIVRGRGARDILLDKMTSSGQEIS